LTAETLSISRARVRLLDQYLLPCPGCARPGAAHVDNEPDGTRVLVRFVCPNACEITSSDVLALIHDPAASLSA
jgi:hypothetical protein